MALHSFKSFYPNSRETFGNQEIVNIDSYSLYTEGDNKAGSVKDALVDDSGRFRYLVVDTGPWIFGKKVLVPIGLAHFDYDQERVYVNGLTREQVENLPEYRDDMVVDESYENQIRDSYRPLAATRSDRQFLGRNYSVTDQQTNTAEMSAPVDASTSVESAGMKATTAGMGASAPVGASGYRTDDYDRELGYYGMSDRENHERLKLYEERLVANKRRQKVGEVVVGKRVETETARASVPVEKERVVIDRHPVTDATPEPGITPDFQSGEVARMEVYEEVPDIQKQAFVREEVDVHKEVDRKTVDAEETIRREELDIDRTGNARENPDVNRDINRSNNPRKNRGL